MPDEFDDDFSDIDPGEVSPAPPISRSRGTGRKTGTAATGRKVSQRKLDTLQQNLSAQMFQAGTMIGFGLPVTGYFIAQESDNFTGAIIKLAERNGNWIKALEQVANVQPGITIGRVVLGMGTALSVDRHKEALEYRSDRFQRIAAFLGVASAYQGVYGGVNEPGAGSYQPPPGQFQPVA